MQTSAIWRNQVIALFKQQQHDFAHVTVTQLNARGTTARVYDRGATVVGVNKQLKRLFKPAIS